MLDIISKQSRSLRAGAILFSIALLVAGCASQNTAGVQPAESGDFDTEWLWIENTEDGVVLQ